MSADSKHPIRVAVFDLDRTITRYATYTPFLLGFAIRHRPWMLLALPAILGAFVAYRFKAISRSKLKSFMLRLMVGEANESTLKAYAAQFADGMTQRQSYAGAINAIAKHRAKGAQLIMATASFDFIAEPIGNALGFDRVIATQSASSGGVLIPKVLGENCYGDEKLRRVEEELADQGVSWDAVAFYSDHHTDIPLMERAGCPVPVNGSAKLDRWALERGIAMLNWRVE